MSKTKKTSGKEEKVITIGAENLMVPIALILVAIVVAVILVSSAENDISEDDKIFYGMVKEYTLYVLKVIME